MPGPTTSGVRPTAGRVREALFSMIGQDLSGLTVLDAFGGSGLLGFEAFSRGASVLIVEQNARVARQIRETAAALGAAAAEVEVRCADVAGVLARGEGGPWDIILMDPPYAQDPLPWLERAAPLVREILAVEHEASREPPDAVGVLRLERRRRYGGTALSLYRPEEG